MGIDVSSFRPILPGFGLQAEGIDLRESMSDAAFGEIAHAFFAGQVLVFREQRLTPAQFAAFARRFGPPEPNEIPSAIRSWITTSWLGARLGSINFSHPDDPNILILSNVVIDDVPQGLANTGIYFHTDYSYLPAPARATTLYSIEVPRRGGDTLFANQYAAYDDLADAMKRRIEPLMAIHHRGNSGSRNDHEKVIRTAASMLTEEHKANMPLVTHPIVRTHPVTQRRALYAVSGSPRGIVGMPKDEALDLLDELAEHAIQNKYRYSHSYRVGDVIIWDNASLLHSATLTAPDDPRTLWRIAIREPTLAASVGGG
jgi:taurine dioxygenase